MLSACTLTVRPSGTSAPLGCTYSYFVFRTASAYRCFCLAGCRRPSHGTSHVGATLPDPPDVRPTGQGDWSEAAADEDRLVRTDTPSQRIVLTRDSFVSVYEAMAMPELGADHITVGLPILTDLASYKALPVHEKGNWKKALKDFPGIAEPHFQWKDWNPPRSEERGKRMVEIAKCDPLSKVMQKDQKLASTDVDYLEGDVLDKLNEEDEVTRLRLAEGLKRFSLMEAESKKFIEELQAKL